jgi:hypothetical protein
MRKEFDPHYNAQHPWLSSIGVRDSDQTLVVYTKTEDAIERLRPIFRNWMGFKVTWQHIGEISPLGGAT